MRWFKVLIAAGLLCQSCGGDKGTTTPDPSLLPSITSVTPAQVSRGRDGINGRIEGTNFSNDALVDMGQGIHVRNVNVKSTTEIAVNFDVSADANPGQRTVVVTTLAGTSNPFLLNVSGNLAPIASFTVSPSSGGQGTLFTFDASGSSDPDGNITAYDWDFGDNQKGTGTIVTHQFTAAGSFRVTLKVTDNQSAVDRLIHDLQVNEQGNLPPHAQFVVTPESGDPSTTFHFDGSSSSDPDGQISEYNWDFGDGSTANGATTDHQFASAALYKVKLTVRDNAGGEAFLEKELNVGGSGGGSPPVAQFTVKPTTGTADTIFSFDASASVDPDGTIVEFKWSMGDGSARHGMIVNHKFLGPGIYTVKLTVLDNSGLKNSLTRQVTVGP